VKILVETEDREESRYGRDKSTAIDHKYINSGEYRRKFDNLTDNIVLNRNLYQSAKKMLVHRSGTDFEDMYWLDGSTGKVFNSITNMNVTSRVVYPQNYMDKHRDIINKVTIHNHPRSMPPSIGDYESAYRNGYSNGVVVCHNGTVYLYKNLTEPSKEVYDTFMNRLLLIGYSDFTASMKTLEEMNARKLLLFREVK
jgi:hypothetical protein